MPSPCGASRCGEKQLGLPPPPRPRHTTEARSGAVRSYRAYQFTADQHPPDFVRTCANIEQFGVAHIALDRPILRISRTAQCLNSLPRPLDGLFAGQQYRPTRVDASRFSSVATARASVNIGSRRIEDATHVRDLCLHQMES